MPAFRAHVKRMRRTDEGSSPTLAWRRVAEAIYQELQRLAGWHDAEVVFSHFRDKDAVGKRFVGGVLLQVSELKGDVEPFADCCFGKALIGGCEFAALANQCGCKMQAVQGTQRTTLKRNGRGRLQDILPHWDQQITTQIQILTKQVEKDLR
jgi:hypothetical protein